MGTSRSTGKTMSRHGLTNQPERLADASLVRRRQSKSFPRPTAGPLRPINSRLLANVRRLNTYKAKLVVFPRRTRKFKAGDSAPEELATATQVQGQFMPIVREKASVELVKVTEEMKSFKAYDKLRMERTNARHVGARLKRAAEAEKEEKK
ncbi:hypothetical protein OIU76_004228 [Salix suchowensis]|nr:hypothetical protein OIU76_004228 [Salix suchowensis]